VAWLKRFSGFGTSRGEIRLDTLEPGDEIWSNGQPWQVTAALIYKDAESQWAIVRAQQGLTTAWVSIEEGQPVRYDHLDLHVEADGRAVWKGKTYARREVGTATILRALGDVDARPGDTLSYEVLRCLDDPHSWINVEVWAGGYVEVSVGRRWSIDRLVTKGKGRA